MLAFIVPFYQCFTNILGLWRNLIVAFFNLGRNVKSSDTLKRLFAILAHFIKVIEVACLREYCNGGYENESLQSVLPCYCFCSYRLCSNCTNCLWNVNIHIVHLVKLLIYYLRCPRNIRGSL